MISTDTSSVKLLTLDLMSLRLIRSIFALLTLSLAVPATVSAQIYTWRDASGNLVLSDRPKNGAPVTFAVGSATSIRTTRPAIGRRNNVFDDLIAEHSAKHGVRPDLVRAVIQAESAFQPTARSPKGAMGLMQLMPGTAHDYGVVDPYNPAENIRAGVAYLKSLLVRYAPREDLALAAYNAGPGAVEKYGAVPPYRETRSYVARITDAAGPQGPQPVLMYRTTQVVNGREIARYSNVPSNGATLVTRTAAR